MSNSTKIGYEVRITGRTNCSPDRSKYNKDFKPYQPVEAKNYFNTLIERYQCFNVVKPGENTHQASGQLYIITLTTIFSSGS